ncbi:MAG: cytochrome c oxidase accessory protein CcoG [Parvibaculum sp.]|uniref:cytochrome c oxidase accessory protein CcoG n=1 Tax=Parvibaculum sp. TaxID=2024848 RepID=UPI0025E8BB0E|nr:cytochrome c oxidase accessory protein CcoG [Parvibaculum sp.]MCE9650099.1 cytochrome c oxidase accessory protein CcoG [Parvibaculum sp.]
MTNAALNLDALAAQAANIAAGDVDAHAGEEAVHVIDWQSHSPLYESRVKVYPKLVHGIYRRAKWLIMLVTLSIYYGTPWIRWERGAGLPDQAVLLDFPNRRFYFFFIEIWPQEFYYITGLLILAALGLFLVTSVAGRAWCGYACPQTVWTDLFIYVERLFEGDRSARIRLDRGPWTVSKLLRKAGKHAVWLAVGLLTGGAWVFYFGDAPTLARQLLEFNAPVVAYAFIAVFTLTTYSFGGIVREQVCIYMCPWPRIQGAMFDESTFLVSYKEDRGEQRGAHKKGTSWEGRGDCIDCGQCVAACPMGIDIRNGMQMECIQCALCIDACDEIMDRVERPRGLIGYDTNDNQERRRRGEAERFNLIRPRTIVYGAALLLVSGIMLFALLNRPLIELGVLRDRNPLFVVLSDGSIRNGYSLKVINKDYAAHVFRISTAGIDGAHLMLSAQDAGEVDVEVGPDTLKDLRLFVSVPRDRLSVLKNGEASLRFVVTAVDTGRKVESTTSFRGPVQ